MSKNLKETNELETPPTPLSQRLYPDLNLSTPAHNLGYNETEYVKTLNEETKSAR